MVVALANAEELHAGQPVSGTLYLVAFYGRCRASSIWLTNKVCIPTYPRLRPRLRRCCRSACMLLFLLTGFPARCCRRFGFGCVCWRMLCTTERLLLRFVPMKLAVDAIVMLGMFAATASTPSALDTELCRPAAPRLALCTPPPLSRGTPTPTTPATSLLLRLLLGATGIL